jgi:hypothetical protein
MSERKEPGGRLVYFRCAASSIDTDHPAQHESSQAGPMQVNRLA